MTPAGVPDDLAAEVAESRAKQGLPPTISDRETIAKVAALVADALAANGNGGPPRDRPPREPEGRHHRTAARQT